MFSLNRTLSNQSGSTLVIVIVVLMALSMMGLASINISSIDTDLAGNEKFQKQVFYDADAGFHGTPNIIAMPWQDNTDAPDDSVDGDGNCLKYLNTLDPQTFEALLINKRGVSGCDDPPTPDISFRNCGVMANVDICFTTGKASAGGGVEFASKSEGLGLSGVVNAEYRIISTGQSIDNTLYTVTGHYLWNDIPGGLK